MGFVWVLVGTNNIDNYLHACDDVRLYPFDLAGFIEEYRNMLLTISGHVRNIHIVSRGIIPRLCDFEESKDIINKVNQKMGKICEKLHVEFCPVVKPFCFTGIPQEVFYRPDMLHLSRRRQYQNATVTFCIITNLSSLTIFWCCAYSNLSYSTRLQNIDQFATHFSFQVHL